MGIKLIGLVIALVGAIVALTSGFAAHNIPFSVGGSVVCVIGILGLIFG